MYGRYEDTRRRGDRSTRRRLDTVNNLGNLYADQGKIVGGGGDVCAGAARIREGIRNRPSEDSNHCPQSM
jgi:hypothetical protein